MKVIVGSRVSVEYHSPSVYTLVQAVEGISEQVPWTMWGHGQGDPLHPFCVLQQSLHQADDLGDWLGRVILREEVAHILLGVGLALSNKPEDPGGRGQPE